MAITPGPSVIYVVSYSLRYGSKAGVMSTLGINLGSIVAILIAALGLSTVVEHYPNALLLVQILGGVFVIYLAYQIWPQRVSHNIDDKNMPEESYGTLFQNGFITSVLNPKDILFYTAFIPTFIPTLVTGKSYQSYFLILAGIYILIGFITKSAFAIFAGYTKNALSSGKAVMLNYVSSLMLFLLGVYLIVKALSQYIGYS